MSKSVENLTAKDYLTDTHPVWCPGCGHFFILRALAKALAWLKIPNEDIALISGIGCSSRIPAYVDVYGFHSIHGRALPIAQGLKAARPDLQCDRCRRRWRRVLYRREPFYACLPPQYGYDLYCHGQ